MIRRDEINTYQYGNTVRFECTFYGFDGEKIDPENVRIIIYDPRYKKMFEGEGIRVEEGSYYYDYTTEEKEQRYYYEWCGEIDNKPSLKRGQFMTRFF